MGESHCDWEESTSSMAIIPSFLHFKFSRLWACFMSGWKYRSTSCLINADLVLHCFKETKVGPSHAPKLCINENKLFSIGERVLKDLLYNPYWIYRLNSSLHCVDPLAHFGAFASYCKRHLLNVRLRSGCFFGILLYCLQARWFIAKCMYHECGRVWGNEEHEIFGKFSCLPVKFEFGSESFRWNSL